MCGRFLLTATPDEVRRLFEHVDQPNFPPREDIRPTEPIGVVVVAEGARRFRLVRWGFVPSWVKDPRDFPLMINARGETAAEKPSFRGAMRHGRCLVPASGFIEWRRDGDGSRHPFRVMPRDGGLVAFAGLTETWAGADGSEVDTAAILTVDANATIAAVHDRMPAVIAPADFAAFCDAAGLVSMPASAETVGAYITSLADSGAAAATIDRRLSTLRAAHRAAGHEPPSSEALRLLRRGIRRTIGTAQQQAAALGLEDVRRMVATLPADCIDDAARDRAVILVGFAAALRRSEVAALELEDVRFESAGMTITIRKSKTDQEGAGRLVAIPYARRPEVCPVRALQAWIERAGLTSGSLFGIGEKTVCRIVQRAADRAGIDAARVSGHSLRAG